MSTQAWNVQGAQHPSLQKGNSSCAVLGALEDWLDGQAVPGLLLNDFLQLAEIDGKEMTFYGQKKLIFGSIGKVFIFLTKRQKQDCTSLDKSQTF